MRQSCFIRPKTSNAPETHNLIRKVNVLRAAGVTRAFGSFTTWIKYSFVHKSHGPWPSCFLTKYIRGGSSRSLCVSVCSRLKMFVDKPPSPDSHLLWPSFSFGCHRRQVSSSSLCPSTIYHYRWEFHNFRIRLRYSTSPISFIHPTIFEHKHFAIYDELPNKLIHSNSPKYVRIYLFSLLRYTIRVTSGWYCIYTRT